MSEPFDLDALENEDTPFEFIHKGTTYTLPPDIDLTAVGLIDTGDFDRAFEWLLGEETWKGLKAAGGFGVKRMLRLLDAYAKHLGLDSMGGLLASAASSPTTA